MLIEIRADPGVVIPEHAHPAEQIGYIISGEVELSIAGISYRFAPGDSYAIPGGVIHSARFQTACVLVEYFTPVREEYRRRPRA
jgi:quercetin dioxygenase-like cupin family protein